MSFIFFNIGQSSRQASHWISSKGKPSEDYISSQEVFMNAHGWANCPLFWLPKAFQAYSNHNNRLNCLLAPWKIRILACLHLCAHHMFSEWVTTTEYILSYILPYWLNNITFVHIFLLSLLNLIHLFPSLNINIFLFLYIKPKLWLLLMKHTVTKPHNLLLVVKSVTLLITILKNVCFYVFLCTYICVCPFIYVSYYFLPQNLS